MPRLANPPPCFPSGWGCVDLCHKPQRGYFKRRNLCRCITLLILENNDSGDVDDAAADGGGSDVGDAGHCHHLL